MQVITDTRCALTPKNREPQTTRNKQQRKIFSDACSRTNVFREAKSLPRAKFEEIVSPHGALSRPKEVQEQVAKSS